MASINQPIFCIWEAIGAVWYRKLSALLRYILIMTGLFAMISAVISRKAVAEAEHLSCISLTTCRKRFSASPPGARMEVIQITKVLLIDRGRLLRQMRVFGIWDAQFIGCKLFVAM